MLPNPALHLSGERFSVLYRVTAASEAEAAARACDVAIEQTVEFPASLVPSNIEAQIVGRIERLTPVGGAWHAQVAYPVEAAGGEFTQFLNVLFGNSSIKPGLRVESFVLPPSMLAWFKGPRFGRQGLRAYLGVPERPLLCTALKPMGLSAAELAELAYQFALGGIDIIKDDHGLANQVFSPFAERVERCAEAVARANRQTGRKAIYMPHVTAPAEQALERALLAKRLGAGGLLYCPGLGGLDTMRMLADDDRIALPIMSHPALQGPFVTSTESGIAHGALFGTLARLAGADATVYPNYGGRFAFSRAECQAIAEGTVAELGRLAPIFPAPGGGMTLERVPELLELYGREVIFLIGGGLFQRGPDLVENSRHFLSLIEQ